jgi:E3 ubiquitin-protein ligase DOA10
VCQANNKQTTLLKIEIKTYKKACSIGISFCLYNNFSSSMTFRVAAILFAFSSSTSRSACMVFFFFGSIYAIVYRVTLYQVSVLIGTLNPISKCINGQITIQMKRTLFATNITKPTDKVKVSPFNLNQRSLQVNHFLMWQCHNCFF